MPKQTQRLTWRLAKKDRGTETRARELWLHRPGEDPVHVGGTYFAWDSYTNSYWSWYSTQGPWAHLTERFYPTESYATPEEAMERLRTRPHILHWPKKHCTLCTAIGCTQCEAELCGRCNKPPGLCFCKPVAQT